MAEAKTSANPELLIQQITDKYLLQNFESLRDYFAAQNQLLNFNFFEKVFTKKETDVQIAHGLPTAPLDVLVSQITGTGAVTFKLGKFTDKVIILDASDACRIRFYVGTHWKTPGSVSVDADASTTFYPTATGAAAGVVEDNNPVGMMIDMLDTVAPPGYVSAEGQVLKQADYPKLYAKWLANGLAAVFASGQPAIASDSFYMPDLRRRVTMGQGGVVAYTPNNTVGAVGGAELYALSIAEMPTHNHGGGSHQHFDGWGGDGGIGGQFGGVNSANIRISYDAGAISGTYHAWTSGESTTVVQSQGGGGNHGNVQPSFVVYKCVKY